MGSRRLSSSFIDRNPIGQLDGKRDRAVLDLLRVASHANGFLPRGLLLLCSIVSVMTGSSWTTIATIGIALMGIGEAQGFATGWVAGAIISGAYFGDKISPLSDTTVLASSVTHTPLFSHIRYMMLTTIPSMVITLIIFTIAGFTHTSNASGK